MWLALDFAQLTRSVREGLHQIFLPASSHTGVMDRGQAPNFNIRSGVKRALVVTCGLLVAAHLAYVGIARNGGSESVLLAFPLAVVFPALLVVGLLWLPPTATREGALMRLGTVLQLLLILALPDLRCISRSVSLLSS
jgi:hypothetical protein